MQNCSKEIKMSRHPIYGESRCACFQLFEIWPSVQCSDEAERKLKKTLLVLGQREGNKIR